MLRKLLYQALKDTINNAKSHVGTCRRYLFAMIIGSIVYYYVSGFNKEKVTEELIIFYCYALAPGTLYLVGQFLFNYARAPYRINEELKNADTIIDLNTLKNNVFILAKEILDYCGDHFIRRNEIKYNPEDYESTRIPDYEYKAETEFERLKFDADASDIYFQRFKNRVILIRDKLIQHGFKDGELDSLYQHVRNINEIRTIGERLNYLAELIDYAN